MVTIESIARELGVSRSAVSHVLNGRGHKVSPETRQRVLDLARRYDYQPNALVRAIQTKRSHSIAVLVPELWVSFFSSVVSAIEVAAEERGYQVLVGQTHSSHERAEKQIRLLRQKRVDGLIVSPHPGAMAFYSQLKAAGFPMVFVDSRVPGSGIPCVHSDDVLGATLAVRHLIGLGHTRIATFRVPADQQSLPYGDRLTGYTAALSEAALPLDSGWVAEASNPLSVHAAASALLPRGVTALFTPNDLMALYAMEAIKAAGRRVPQDLAVMGYANLSEGAYYTPRLSTVDQKTEDIGRRAAMVLIDRIEQPELTPPMESLTVPELVIRESCGAGRQVRIEERI